MTGWWQTGIIYQIYPRSFMDSNDDGVGDLRGIAARLDYLVELGVDAVWISPFYPSPMADFGYDVTDYTGVDPLFGTMADFDRLLAEAHAHGLKVILDFVPNHTSRLHPWFCDARTSRQSPKRHWYIWRDGQAGGKPPNNWLSMFGGSAWTWDETAGQYYYHAFLEAQPDLNWRNPDLRAAMYNAMRFWLDRGIDGFRVDVLWHLGKDPAFRDEPENPDWRPGEDPYFKLKHSYSCNQPFVHDIAREMRHLIDEKPNRVLIGEIYLPIPELVAYYGVNGDGVHLPFNFHLLTTPWRAESLAALIRNYEAALPRGAWPNWVLGNHDRARLASRVGQAQTRVAAMLLLTLRGTPTLYYGDELGLENVAIPPDHVRDPWEKNVPGLGLGRDPVRTPMPWAPVEGGGFTRGTPWLPLNPDYRTRNVQSQSADNASLLAFYRRLIRFRRESDALKFGMVTAEADGNVLRLERKSERESLIILLNLSNDSQRTTLVRAPMDIVLSTAPQSETYYSPETVLPGNTGLILAPPRK